MNTIKINENSIIFDDGYALDHLKMKDAANRNINKVDTIMQLNDIYENIKAFKINTKVDYSIIRKYVEYNREVEKKCSQMGLKLTHGDNGICDIIFIQENYKLAIENDNDIYIIWRFKFDDDKLNSEHKLAMCYNITEAINEFNKKEADYICIINKNSWMIKNLIMKMDI